MLPKETSGDWTRAAVGSAPASAPLEIDPPPSRSQGWTGGQIRIAGFHDHPLCEELPDVGF